MALAATTRGASADPFTSVVTGTRTAGSAATSPVATEVVTREQIERSGARDLAEVLQTGLGLEVDRGFSGAGISLRGLDPQYVLILVDGQRVTGRVNGTIDLQRFQVDEIERVEVVRGPASVLYGTDALGGVINIITRRARRRFEADGSVSYGTLDAVDAAAGAGMRRGPIGLRVSGGYHHRDAYDRDETGPATTLPRFDEWRVGAELELLQRKLRSGAIVRGLATLEYLRRDVRAVEEGAGGAIFDRRNATQTVQALLAPELLLPGGTKVRLTLAYSFFSDQFLRDQRGANDLDTFDRTRDELGRIELQVDQKLPAGHLLTVGGEAQLEHLASGRVDAGLAFRARGALLAQDQWAIASGGRTVFVVVPALRVDVDSQFGTWVSPKLALRADPHRQVTVRASYGRGYRAPTFKELTLRFDNTSAGYSVQGNPALRPESSHGVDLALEVRPRTWMSLAVSGYYNWIRDLIQPTAVGTSGPGVPQLYLYENVTSAYTRGIEAALHVGPLAGRWQVMIDLSAAVTDAIDEQARRALPGRALLRGTFGASVVVAPSKLELSVRGTVLGTRPYYVDENGDGTEDVVHAPPAVLLDARVAYPVKRYVTVFVAARNLADAGDPKLFIVPPRSFYGGVSARY